ncbi:hypothetical protein AA313_de0203807 [Arthrobotrys entomopaga]|nr:hypothetical protein AA313_de0203807 [Arthrobotrys entomopaga]
MNSNSIVGTISISPANAPANLGGDQCGPSNDGFNYCDGAFPKECGNWLGYKNYCCYGEVVALGGGGTPYKVSCDTFPQLSDNTYDALAKLPGNDTTCIHVIVVYFDEKDNVQARPNLCVDLNYDTTTGQSGAQSGNSTTTTTAITTPTTSVKPNSALRKHGSLSVLASFIVGSMFDCNVSWGITFVEVDNGVSKFSVVALEL